MSDLLQSFGEWWVDLILLLPRIIYAGALSVMESVLLLIPQSQVVDPSQFYGSFTSDLIYFLTLFEAPTGLGLVVTASISRFIVRRIPLVG